MQISAYICVRDTVLTYVSQEYHGFEFIDPLVADMVQSDPTQHPKMDEVGDRFSKNRGELSTWKLRSRIVRQDEIWPLAIWKSVGRWYRTVSYVVDQQGSYS